jgi:hypothetical protein
MRRLVCVFVPESSVIPNCYLIKVSGAELGSSYDTEVVATKVIIFLLTIYNSSTIRLRQSSKTDVFRKESVLKLTEYTNTGIAIKSRRLTI